MFKQGYKRLLRNDNYDSLIKIIETIYVRDNKRLNNKNKISEKGNEYFRMVESYYILNFWLC